MKAFAGALGIGLGYTLAAWAGTSKTAAIDDFCQATRAEFVEATPQFFSGPDPWVQLDRLPAAFADAAVATVYYEGHQVKWVVLSMQGPDNVWYETTHYFFDAKGLVEKRERHLDEYKSHIQVDEDLYFRDRKVFKTTYHHRALSENDQPDAHRAGAADKENWDTFFDPDAPFYTDREDLPRVFLDGGGAQLAKR